MHANRLIFASLFMPTLACAQTFVVDASGAAGSHFTSLAVAAATVPDGSTLLVAPGAYAGPVVVSAKGLTILASGAQIVGGGTQIANTLPSQANVFRGFAMTSISGAPAVLGVSGCQGNVVVEDCTVATPIPIPSTASVSVVQSTQVTLRNCSFLCAGAFVAADVVVENCSFLGRAGQWPPSLSGFGPATPAITIGSGHVQLVASTAHGGGGSCFLGCTPGVPPTPYDNAPGVLMNGGQLTVRGGSIVRGGAHGVQHAAIEGSGAVRIDPTATVAGPSAVAPAAVVVGMPGVRSSSAPLGGAITAVADGNGTPLFLLLSLPGATLAVPGIDDSFWLDPAFHFWAAVGAAPLTASVAVPPQPALRGFRLVWQAVAWTPALGLQASNPSLAFVQ